MDYYLTPEEIKFVTGLIVGLSASTALLIVPLLRRALVAATFGLLVWGVYSLGPEPLGAELLRYARLAVTPDAFVRGFMIGNGVAALIVMILRRRAG
jgi:hypothetical protein